MFLECVGVNLQREQEIVCLGNVEYLLSMICL